MTTPARPLPLLMFWVPPRATVVLRDGGRWLIVRHTGDEMAPVEWDAEGFFHFADSVTWSVASSATRPPVLEEVQGV